MNTTLRFGRIAGIEIGANWSWAIVFVLILWTLGASVFPAENPGLASGVYATMALAAAPVFFGSLLLHELGHALTAQRQGMTIEGITLWLFGGVARFAGEFPSARAEFRVAIAGPLVSIALGGTFVLVALVTNLGRAVDGVLSWLGYINLFLAAFNLLPAQPLDGGRVLHAALWRGTGDLLIATRWAAHAGEVLGWVMIAGGILMVVTTGALGGFWLAFLGWFLMTAARSEAQSVVVHHALDHLPVGALMTANPVTVSSGTSLAVFMETVARHTRFAGYPVIDVRGVTLGLIAFRSVAAVPRERWDAEYVDAHMIPIRDLLVVESGEPAVSVLDRIIATPGRRAVVIDHGALVGVVSVADMVRAVEVRGATTSTHRRVSR
jgi:Zn-dependent protease/CBS domain-containing protein